MPTLGWEEQQSSKENTTKDHDQSHQDQRPPKLEQEGDASTDKTPPKSDSVEGDGQRSTVDVNRLNVNFASPYDSDRKDLHISSFHFDSRSNGHLAMPHRVEPYIISSSHRRHYDPYDHRRQSPPLPALTHSPSTSAPALDRGHGSTPPIRRASPHPIPATHLYPVYAAPDPALLTPRHHYLPRESIPHGYIYHHAPPPHLDPRYDPHPHGPPQPHEAHIYSPYHHPSPIHSHPSSIPPMHVPPPHHQQPHHPQHTRDPYGHPYPPSHPSPHPAPHPAQPGPQIIHTDDAATKLSDRVRRRCFNCCTTDTSTWRRSNLHPGKVLCNKCGLFERTHSRPRPEQFPHKRGPLASSTLRSRSPTQSQPGGEPQHQQQHQVPSMNPVPSSSSPYYTHPAPAPPLERREYNTSAQGPASSSGRTTPLHQRQGGPEQGNGPTTTTLPGLQSWHNVTSPVPPASAPLPTPSSDPPTAVGVSPPSVSPADVDTDGKRSPDGAKPRVRTPQGEKDTQGESAAPSLQTQASNAETA